MCWPTCLREMLGQLEPAQTGRCLVLACQGEARRPLFLRTAAHLNLVSTQTCALDSFPGFILSWSLVPSNSFLFTSGNSSSLTKIETNPGSSSSQQQVLACTAVEKGWGEVCVGMFHICLAAVLIKAGTCWHSALTLHLGPP